MCESTIIIDDGENREEVMMDVVKVYVDENSIHCIDITGDTKKFEGVLITEIDSLKHNIVLKKI
jgi:predicted RNA-binding protein